MKRTIAIIVLILTMIATPIVSFGAANNAGNVSTKQNATTNVSNAGDTTNEIISRSTKGELVRIRNTELKSIKDYEASYGNVAYGTVAYILNKIRLYSIPLCFLGFAVSSIYQFVLGIRDMSKLSKGFNTMIMIVTVFVICQVLPLVYAIVIKGWRA